MNGGALGSWYLAMVVSDMGRFILRRSDSLKSGVSATACDTPSVLKTSHRHVCYHIICPVSTCDCIGCTMRDQGRQSLWAASRILFCVTPVVQAS